MKIKGIFEIERAGSKYINVNEIEIEHFVETYVNVGNTQEYISVLAYFTIPAGFIWDGAKGPKWLRKWLGIDTTLGTCVHDRLYDNNEITSVTLSLVKRNPLFKNLNPNINISRGEADEIMYVILRDFDKIRFWKRILAYLAVRLLGWSRWRNIV